MKQFKIIYLVILLIYTSNLYSQNGVYIITEVFPNNGSTQMLYDSVFVTNPLGEVSVYSIPYISNVAAHDSELNKIINSVTSQGFEIIDIEPFARIDLSTLTAFENKTLVRWFLREL